MFGDLVKQLRAQKRLGLREFCEKLSIDPSRWSKIERGILTPPTDSEILGLISKELGLEVGSEEDQKLRDYASLSKGQIPDDIMNDERLLASLPVVFRTIRGDKPTKEDLRNISDLLRHG